MATDWPILTVAECASDEPYATQIGPFGEKLRAGSYTTTGVPVLRGTNVNPDGRFHDDAFVFIDPAVAEKEFAKFVCEADDVILCHKGTLGKIGVIPRKNRFGKYIMGNSMMKVRCDRAKLEPLYLYYWLCSIDGQNYIFSRVSQVGVPQIQRPLTTLREASLPVPPLAEQQAVVAVLGALDDQIELNRRMNATLEAMLRALFQSWFVDFDPVRAKLDGRRPVGVDDATAAHFPKHFAHDAFGVLPIGWRRAAIADVCAINERTLAKSDELTTLEYVEISEVNHGDINCVAVYGRGNEPSRARRRLRHGDTALSTVRPDRGSYFLALNPPTNRVASTGFAVLTPKSVPWSFIYAAVTQPEVFVYLGQQADGGAYPAVRPEVVGAISVALPEGTAILEAFHHCCAPLLERAEVNRAESRTLASLRDALLPKLLSGELRVRDVA